MIMQVLEPDHSQPPRVQVLIVHGLNISPRAMVPLAAGLASRGHRVSIVGLTGHRGRREEYALVSAERWRSDVREALVQSGAQNTPVRLIGYSLGGLLSTCVLAEMATRSDARLWVERLVLLAPAIGIRTWARMGEKVARLVPSWIPLRSGVPRRYRASTLVGSHWYRALFDLHRSIMARPVPELFKSLSIQIFMSRRDEFISWDRLFEWTRFAAPDELVRMHELSSRNRSLLTPHHLIIDEPSLGGEQWGYMLEAISSDQLR